MSFGGSGGGTGQIKYIISVDDSQAIQKLQSVGQSFQQLGQATQQGTQQLQQMPQTLQQVSTESDKVTQSSQQAGMAIKQQGEEAGKAAQQQQTFGQVVKDNVASLIQIGTGIAGLVGNYLSLERTQIRINKLEITETNQRRMLDVLTRKHADAVAKYGANSQEALDIENKIVVLQGRHQVVLDQLNLAQEQQTLGQINFGLSLIQTGSGLAQAVTGFKTYKGAADAAKVATTGLTMSMNKLKIATVIGSILVGIEVAAQAVANNWGNLQQKLDEFYNWLLNVAPAFQPVIDAIWTVGKALTALFTGDFDALNKMFSQTAEAAPAAAGGVDELSDSLTESGKAAEEAKQKMDEFISKGVQGIIEASQGNRSEQRDFLKSLGIKGDEKKRMRDFLDDIEDGTKEMDQATRKLETIKGFDMLARLGFKLPKGAIEDMINTLDSDFRDAVSGKNDPFEKLANILDESGADTLPEVAKIFEDFFTDPKLFEALQHVNPELAAAVAAIMGKTQEELTKAGTETPLKLPPPTFEMSNDAWAAEGMGDADDAATEAKGGTFSKLFEQMKQSITKGIPEVAAVLTNPTTWKTAIDTAAAGLTTIGTTVWDYIKQPLTDFANLVDPVIAQLFSPTSWTSAINAIGTNLAIVGTTVWNYIRDGLVAVFDDPIGALTTVKNALVGAFEFVIASAASVDWEGIGNTIVTAIGDWFATNFPKTSEAVVDMVTALATAITDVNNWGNAFSSLQDAFSGIATSLGQYLVIGFTSATDFFTDIVDSLLDVNKWASAFASAQNLFTKLAGSFGDYLVKGIQSAPEVFKNIIAAIINGITGGNLDEYDKNTQENPQGYWWQSDQFKGLLTPASFGAGNGDMFGDQGIFSKDIIAQLEKPLFSGGGFGGSPSSGMSNKQKTGYNIPIGFSVDGKTGTWSTIKALLTAKTNELGTTMANINKRMGPFQGIKLAFDAAIGQVLSLMVLFQKQWSTDMNKMGENAKSGGKQIEKGIYAGLISVGEGMAELAKGWSKIANSMGKNAASAGKQIEKNIYKALISVGEGMAELAKGWSKICNSLINNAKSAASGINKALGSIKDVSVTVNVGLSGAGATFLGTGGTIKLAKGGLVSAAKGYTTNGPQLMLVGDNPGGRETVAVVPHNDPWPTIGLLEKQFGHSRGDSGSGSTVNQVINLKISGNDIINERNLIKKIKLTVGENRDKFG